MLDFLKGIIIFITTITLPISGLFVHSKPVTKPILTPTPTISISISPAPKSSPSAQAKETSAKPSLTSVDKKLLKIREEMQRTLQQIQENRQPTPTPSKEITTTAPQIIISTSTPTPTPSYNDLHCPKILKTEDSLGNQATAFDIGGIIKKSEVNTLTVKIIASDPQNLPLHFQFLPDSSLGADMKDWSTDTSFTMDISKATIGNHRGIWIRVDNQDGYGCIGAYYDTQAYFSYDIIP